MLVVRPTGAGKTLCFQLPALLSAGTTFVLSPLKALMKEQAAELQRLKVPATFVNGDLGPDEKEARYQLLECGALKFLYCTPERFNENRVRPAEVERLSRQKPSFLVVDEAHCVDRWGDDFRPDYARIGEIRERLGSPPVLAFTATAGVEAQQRILDSLGIPDAKRFVTGADRPNIALVRHILPGDVREPEQVKSRARLIARLVQILPDGKAMIFVPTVRIGDALKQAIAAEGIDLPFYSAKGGTPNERDTIVGRFTGRLNPPLRAVICTNAFGMGIDVPDVRLVINWQHPASVEEYLQEFGRAGRDGKPALAVLLSEGGSERDLLDFMAAKTAESVPDPEQARKSLERKLRRIDAINELVVDRKCFRVGLLSYLVGEEPPRKGSLARRFLEWVFSERRHISDASFCCDACHSEQAQVALGALGSN